MALIDYINNAYIQIALVIIIFYTFSLIVNFTLRKVIPALTKKTKTNLDDLILEKINKPITLFVLFIALHVVFKILRLPEAYIPLASNLLNTFLTILGTYMVIVVVDIIIDHWGKVWAKKTKSNLDKDVLPLFHKISRVIFFIAGLVIILRIWGVNITGLVAGLGVAGLVIGLALKDSLSNIFGGISLILDRAVKVGDFIELDSKESGEIVDIGLRSTRMKTWNNEILIIPNNTLSNATIKNWKLPDLTARAIIDFGVEYGNDPKKVRKVALDVLKKYKNILNEPEPTVYFLEMGESSINFRLAFYVEDVNKRYTTKVSVIEDLYNALRKEKINIPFPTRTIYMKKQ